MDALERKHLKFSNDIRLQDAVSIIEIRFWDRHAARQSLN